MHRTYVPLGGCLARLAMSCLLLTTFGFASTASASPSEGQYLQSRFERSQWRAMGGVDIAVDPSTPANGALGGGFRLRVFGVDAYSTLSEGIRAVRKGYDLWDTRLRDQLQDREDMEQLQQALETIADSVRGEDFYLEFANRIELLNALINLEHVSLQIGAYTEGVGGARFQAPQTIELREDDLGDSYLFLGRRTRVIRAGARQDAGISLGIGTSIAIGEHNNFRLAIGARVRGFYRLMLPLADSWIDAEVRGPANVAFPGPARMRRGFGFGTDLYASVHFNDDNTGFRIATYVEDLLAYALQADGTDFLIPPRVGVGFAWTSTNEKFTLGLDVERIELLDPTLQLGLSTRLGSEGLGIHPMAGVIINHRDIEGSTLSPAITAGLKLALSFLHIAAVAEYQTGQNTFNAGLSLTFGTH